VTASPQRGQRSLPAPMSGTRYQQRSHRARSAFRTPTNTPLSVPGLVKSGQAFRTSRSVSSNCTSLTWSKKRAVSTPLVSLGATENASSGAQSRPGNIARKSSLVCVASGVTCASAGESEMNTSTSADEPISLATRADSIARLASVRRACSGSSEMVRNGQKWSKMVKNGQK
jgi:hypothetical protein